MPRRSIFRVREGYGSNGVVFVEGAGGRGGVCFYFKGINHTLYTIESIFESRQPSSLECLFSYFPAFFFHPSIISLHPPVVPNPSPVERWFVLIRPIYRFGGLGAQCLPPHLGRRRQQYIFVRHIVQTRRARCLLDERVMEIIVLYGPRSHIFSNRFAVGAVFRVPCLSVHT